MADEWYWPYAGMSERAVQEHADQLRASLAEDEQELANAKAEFEAAVAEWEDGIGQNREVLAKLDADLAKRRAQVADDEALYEEQCRLPTAAEVDHGGPPSRVIRNPGLVIEQVFYRYPDGHEEPA